MNSSNKIDNCSLVIDVAGDQLDCKYLAATGIIIDQFTIRKIGPRKDELPASSPDAVLKVYPNPFSDETTVTYRLERDESVSLRVFDIVGQEVSVLADGSQIQKAGEHEYKLSSAATGMSPGIYFISLTAGGIKSVARMVLIK